MRKLVRRARGTHAEFHVGSRHGLELVFRGQGEAARLVVPRVCQQVLLDEAHCSHVAAHFGARRMYALLAARVWWPNMRKELLAGLPQCQCVNAPRTVRSNLLVSCSRSLRLPGVLAVGPSIS